MKVPRILIAAALALCAIPASAASLSQRDAEFLSTAIQIQVGRYAMASYEQQHGSGAAKNFASSVTSQSLHDLRMLRKLAKQYGVTPPSGPLIQDKYHYSQLVGLSGSALNKKFAREFRISDQINADTYRDEARHGQDRTLKAYAKQRYDAVQREINTLKRF